MMRVVMLLVGGLMLTGGLVACEDDTSSAATDFGVQEGRRPEKDEKRAPPGRADEGGGFQVGDQEQQDAAGDKKPDG